MRKIITLLILFLVLFTIIDDKNIQGNEYSLKEEYYSINFKDKNEFDKQTKRLNIEVTYFIPEINTAQIKVNKKKLASLLKNDRSINYINPTCSTCVRTKTLNNTNRSVINYEENLFNRQWDMKKVTNNAKSYALENKIKTAKVAVVDSGINANHKDLTSINKMINEVPKDGYRGSEKNETGEKKYIKDKLNHGTLVAGQIGASGRLKGINPGVEMNIYRVFGSKKSDILWISKGIIDAANDNNDVINVSLGNYMIKQNNNEKRKLRLDEKVDYDALQNAINYAFKKGSIVVAAVGNDGINVNDSVQIQRQRGLSPDSFSKVYDAPASMKNVLTIGSIDKREKISEFSNWGNNFIDLTTIGGSYRLLDKYGEKDWLEKGYMQKETILSTSANGRYVYQAGTSLAAPKVSGALALVIDKYNLKNEPQKTLNILQEKGIVEKSYMDFNHYGNGQLDVYSLLKG